LFDDVRDDRIGHCHDLLLSRFQRTTPLSLGPHPLDCIRYPFGLIDERVSQIARPLNIIVHLIYNIGKLSDRLYIVVPWLGIQLRNIVCVFNESRCLHDLQWIGRRRQYCRQQGIWIKRDWRDQFVQVSITPLCRR
jgi:hypothetical protein